VVPWGKPVTGLIVGTAGRVRVFAITLAYLAARTTSSSGLDFLFAYQTTTHPYRGIQRPQAVLLKKRIHGVRRSVWEPPRPYLFGGFARSKPGVRIARLQGGNQKLITIKNLGRDAHSASLPRLNGYKTGAGILYGNSRKHTCLRVVKPTLQRCEARRIQHIDPLSSKKKEGGTTGEFAVGCANRFSAITTGVDGRKERLTGSTGEGKRNEIG